MSPRRVGVLGGMGPEATVLLMRKVIAAVETEDDAGHVPLLVHQNPQVPSRIRHLIEGTGADPAPVLAAMARRLEDAGAEALAMPCNTAHHYAPAIRAATGVPFLDMVALSAAHAADLAGPGTTVGVLASPAVRRIALFEPALERAGIVIAYPDDEAALLAAIRSVKATGPSPEARKAFARGSAALLDRGATVQMIACTEFSLMADAVAPAARAFDTLDVLTAAIVGFSLRRAAPHGA